MIVCIAEKPSVARDIAHVIGATQPHDGYIEGNGYQVTWTFGHLCTLKEPNDYTENWKKWSLAALPMIPPRFGIKLIEDTGIKKQFGTIERLMKNADEIINCGDAGQEGELIQRWVMQKAGAKCPVKRLWISSLTEESIRDGFSKLKDQSEYQPLYLAGLSRAIGDWILGMNATRLYTLKYGMNRQVLSIGRVQTPTLALIVNRQKEIDNFVPRQSWVLSTLYRDTKFNAIARDEEAEAEERAEIQEAAAQGKTLNSKGPIFRQVEYATREEGMKVLDAIKDSPFTVVDLSKKKGTEAPPRLYDLTSLQVDCNRKFGFSADTTLQLIQSLYEKKFTTYPRVDTTYLSDDIYPKCPATMNGLFKTTFAGKAPYAELVKPLGGKPLKKSKKVFDSSKVTDHHAIIPTGVPPKGLSDMEQRVFDLVARAFIAAFYPDCKFETTTVIGRVETADSDPVMFRTTGKVIVEEGWKAVFKKAKDTDDDANAQDNDAPLPQFAKGESGPHIPTLTEKWTQPPKPYTEATLLRAMETAGKFVDNDELRDAMKENGIGRPSTRAAIIETLFKRRYIRKERKSLIATPTGIELIGLIHEELLKSPELTGIWEKKLRDIEHRNYDAAQFIDELKQQITDIVRTVMADNSNRRITVVEDVPKAKSTKAKAPARKKRTVKAAVTKEGDICPVCGKGHIIKGKTAFGCSRWKEGCTFRAPLGKQ
jgi:DNA topoisomerase III